MIAFGCCICLLHSMHIALVFVITVYLVSVAGIGSDPLQLNLCISPVPFSFGVWCHFCPSRVMPSDRHCLQKWCSGIAPMSFFQSRYRFGDGHVSIPDHCFVVLATLNDLSYQERAMSAASVCPRNLNSWTSTDLFLSA